MDDKEQQNAHPDRLPVFVQMVQLQEQRIDELADRLAELAKIVSSYGMALKIIGTFAGLTLGAIAASSVQYLLDKLLK